MDYRRPGQDYGKSVPEDVENSGRLLIWLRRHTGAGRVISKGTEYSGSVPGDRIYGTTTTRRLFQHPARNNVNNGGSFSGTAVCYRARKPNSRHCQPRTLENHVVAVQLSGFKTEFKTK